MSYWLLSLGTGRIYGKTMSVEIYYEDSRGNVLCFRHAVVASMENENIRTTADDTEDDPDSSGYIRSCVVCSKEYEDNLE